MLIKRFLTAAVCISAVCLLAQQTRTAFVPMDDGEIRNYEIQLKSGLLNPKKPRLKDARYKKFLNDLGTTFLTAEVPASVKDYRKKGTSQLPSKAKIRRVAQDLRELLKSPELEEVSGFKEAWFRSVGNAVLDLEGFQSSMVDAVMVNNEKRYLELYYKYRLALKKLDTLLRNPERLSPSERRKIADRNSAERARQYKQLEQRYTKTMRMREEAERKKQRDSRRGGRGGRR